MFPGISVIIPLYNKEYTISDTIKSVQSQNYDNWELIIVDDGSTDKSGQIVEEYLNDDRIKYYYKENGGPSSARNFGVDKASKKWILFLDADDYFLPDAFVTYGNLIQQNSDIRFFVCNFWCERDTNRKLYSYKYKNGILKNNFFAWLWGRCMPRTGACIVHKSLCIKYPYNDKLRRFEDAGVIFKMFAKCKILTCKTPVMVYNKNTLAASKGRDDINEDYVSCMDLNNGSFWERMAKYDLLFQNMKLYPEQLKALYPQEVRKWHIWIFLKLCHFISVVENGAYKLFFR